MSSEQKVITELFSIFLELKPRYPGLSASPPSPLQKQAESKLGTREGGFGLTLAQGERRRMAPRSKWAAQVTMQKAPTSPPREDSTALGQNTIFSSLLTLQSREKLSSRLNGKASA